MEFAAFTRKLLKNGSRANSVGTVDLNRERAKLETAFPLRHNPCLSICNTSRSCARVHAVDVSYSHDLHGDAPYRCTIHRVSGHVCSVNRT
jgi:hypothetical protein